MRKTEGGDLDLRMDLHGVATHEFAEIDLGPEQVLHLDGEKGVLDLVLHQLDERIPRSGFAINHKTILGGIGGREKRQALNMIPVRMG
jgi:hypothetical protein